MYLFPLIFAFGTNSVERSSPALLVIFSVLPHSIILLSELWLFFVCNMVNRVFLLCTVSCDSFKRFVIPPNLKVQFCVTTYSLAWDHMSSQGCGRKWDSVMFCALVILFHHED